jgi:hypothetical protein
MRVRLIKDLSQYDEHLVVGAEGIARENKVTFTAWEQPMVEVKIPGAKALPIGWNALEIIDKGFWKDKERDIKQATKILLVKGPRGGFKFMRIWSIDRKGIERIYTTDVKHEAEKLLLIAEQYHKKVSEEVK